MKASLGWAPILCLSLLAACDPGPPAPPPSGVREMPRQRAEEHPTADPHQGDAAPPRAPLDPSVPTPASLDAIQPNSGQ